MNEEQNPAKKQLNEYLKRYVDFNSSELDAVYEALNYKELKKRENLLVEGQTCRNMYFVLTGLLRSFYIDNKGEERITQFAIENWWMSSMESFVQETPSYVTIQAVEDTTLLVLSKETLNQLYVSIPKMERFFRMITERMLVSLLRKNDIYLKMSSRDRYLDLIGQFPGFAQRVPQYMIASYLEITPEYLSHLRRNIIPS